jgi:hypothetical protein
MTYTRQSCPANGSYRVWERQLILSAIAARRDART